jgi:hypothetical protein
MTESAAPAPTEVTLATAAHANPLYPLDAPLIRISASGQPDAVTAAIADSGPVRMGCQPGRLSMAPAAIALTSPAWSRSFWSAYRWANWLIAAVKFGPFPM